MECKRCLNNNTVRHISFDSEGVCSFCRTYEELEKKLNDRSLTRELFAERIDRARDGHAYDVAVGISGGKDSVYILHMLKEKYKLRIKAFTLDNGFLSPQAEENINRIVKELGVAHEYVRFDHTVLRRIYRETMKKALVPCIACAYVGYAAMIGYASRIDAGICIHGRSPQQMLRSYGSDVFTEMVDMGFRHTDEINVGKTYLNLLDIVREKVSKAIYDDIRAMAFDGLREEDFREFVPYFLYHPYDEAQIVAYLKENTIWTPPKEYDHFDCEVHNAARYIYRCAEGRPHILPEISVLIRSGAITKDEGRKMLEEAELGEKPQEELDRLCSFVGLSETSLMLKARLYRQYLRIKQ